VGSTVHPDHAFDNRPSRTVLDGFGFTEAFASKGVPTPIQVGMRCAVERTQAWMNGYGESCRSMETTSAVIDFYLFLAASFVVTRLLIQRAGRRYRWPTRPTMHPLE